MEKNQEEPPLPPGWTRQFSKSQQRHYYAHREHGSVWEHPVSWLARKVVPAHAGAVNVEVTTKSTTLLEESNEVSRAVSDRCQKRPRTGESITQTSVAPASSSRPSVAIIVPFRDEHVEQRRTEHLRRFIPYMTDFMSKLNCRFHIFVVEQSADGRKFNRGKLLNIGFILAEAAGHEIFVFHDVDLLPNDALGPAYVTLPPVSGPVHIARCWDRYNSNPRYFGGIVAFSRVQFRAINGFPNTFWGWGGEDDELQLRSAAVGFRITAPPSGGHVVDLEEMDINTKMTVLRNSGEGAENWKCQIKRELLAEHSSTWRTNGLSDLQYSLLTQAPLTYFRTEGGSDGPCTSVNASLDGVPAEISVSGSSALKDQTGTSSHQTEILSCSNSDKEVAGEATRPSGTELIAATRLTVDVKLNGHQSDFVLTYTDWKRVSK